MNELNFKPAWHQLIDSPLLCKLHKRTFPVQYINSEDNYSCGDNILHVGLNSTWTMEFANLYEQYKLTGVFVINGTAIKYDVCFLVNKLKIHRLSLNIIDLFNMFPLIIPCYMRFNLFKETFSNICNFILTDTIGFFNKKAINYLMGYNVMDFLDVLNQQKPNITLNNFEPGLMCLSIYDLDATMCCMKYNNCSSFEIKWISDAFNILELFAQYVHNNMFNKRVIEIDSRQLYFYLYLSNFVVNDRYITTNSSALHDKLVALMSVYDMILMDYIRNIYSDFAYFDIKKNIIKKYLCKFACEPVQTLVQTNDVHMSNIYDVCFKLEQMLQDITYETGESYERIELYKTFEEEVIMAKYYNDKINVEAYDNFLLFMNSHSVIRK